MAFASSNSICYNVDVVHHSGMTAMGNGITDSIKVLKSFIYLKRTVRVINGNGSKEKTYILK